MFSSKHSFEQLYDLFIDCFKNPDGYYLDEENKTYKHCYSNCETCTKPGDEKNNNCDKCKLGYTFKEDFINDKNCYNICDNYYYFDEERNYKCTLNKECPEEQKKIIPHKYKCIDECKMDNKYKNEYENICYDICPDGMNAIDNICIKEIVKTDETDESYNELLSSTDMNHKTETDIHLNIDTEQTVKIEHKPILNCSAEDLLSENLMCVGLVLLF